MPGILRNTGGDQEITLGELAAEDMQQTHTHTFM